MKGILGFDPSLVSSGFAYQGQDDYHTGRIRSNKLRGPERLEFIEKSFKEVISAVAAHCGSIDLIVYEGYAMGGAAQRGRFFDMGELGGVLKLVAWRMHIDVLLVPPSNLKQFVTGKGRAEKEEMTEAIAKNWGYLVPQNDEADAFGLLKMGEAFLSSRKPRSSARANALATSQLITQ